jgi:hypothetical protein
VSARDELGVVMHGVTLNLRCAHEPLRRYAAALLGSHVRPPWPRPDLVAEGSWLTPASAGEARRPAFPVAGLDAYGKRMHIGSDQLVWTDTCRDKNLQLRFRRDGERTAFDVAYHFQPSPKKLAKYSDYEGKKYFDLIQYLVFFPIAWHLRRTRGWELIHASAVADGPGAVLIAGPGGAGKSTTCLALVAHAGMRLLTENLVFCDGEYVYPVAEPIRLTDESLALLGDALSQLRDCAAAGPLKQKTMFVPAADPSPSGVRAAHVFLARFSAPGGVQPLAPPVARDLLAASNRLTLELDDFEWWAAALDLLWPGTARAGGDPIGRLVHATPCHALGIDRARGVLPVVEQILACVRGERRPVIEPVIEKEAM